MASLSFPQFSKLPTELRLQIWRHACASALTRPPYLFPWKEGLMEVHKTERSLTDPDFRGIFSMDLSRLWTEIDLPLAIASHESRLVALTEIQSRGPTLRLQGTLLTSQFDREIDSLYLSSKDWKFFDRELEAGIDGEELHGSHTGTLRLNLAHYAIPWTDMSRIVRSEQNGHHREYHALISMLFWDRDPEHVDTIDIVTDVQGRIPEPARFEVIPGAVQTIARHRFPERVVLGSDAEGQRHAEMLRAVAGLFWNAPRRREEIQLRLVRCAGGFAGRGWREDMLYWPNVSILAI